MVARSRAIIFIEFLQKVRIANLGPVISAITESQTESRNQTSKKEFSFCQNYCNLALLNRNLQVNKLISTLWLTNCHFYASPRCLHVKGSRRSTLDACFWMRTAQPIIKITVTKIVRMPFFHWIMIM